MSAKITPPHNPNLPRTHEEPGTGAETIPPGATEQAENRPINRPRGPNEDVSPKPNIDEPPKRKRRKSS